MEANSAAAAGCCDPATASDTNNQQTEQPYGTIPAELRAQPRWVVARCEPRATGKPAKVPYSPLDSTRRADTTDAATWSDFATAQQLVDRGGFPMLGFVIGGGFVGVDLDNCRDPETGAVDPWAQAIVDRLHSYTEVSVSGTGVHVLCRGMLPVDGRRKGSIEMYAAKHYFVMTGNVYGVEAPIAGRSEELAAVYAEFFGDDAADATGPAASDEPAETINLTDDELLAKIEASAQGDKFRQLWNGDWSGYTSQSEADLALCAILAWWTNKGALRIDRLFRRSKLYRDKWDRKDIGERTIRRAIKRVDKGYDPTAASADDDAATVEPTAARGKASKAHASALVSLVTNAPDAELFHSPDNVPYVTVDHKTMNLRQSEFSQWLSRAYFVATNRVASASAIANAIRTLTGCALNDGPERQVFNRIADLGHAVYVDLGTTGIVEVTPTGWQVLPHAADVRFIRRPGFLSLPAPLHNADRLDALFTSFLNVHDERDLRLIVAWVLAALRGLKPFPILSVNGEQGSAKSSACRFLRRLIDPNTADTRLPPRDIRDLMIAAHNSYVIACDNLSKIDETLANGLCCLSTGAGSATRALTTDTDEIIINAARPILLNGIHDVVKRADLLERTLQVTLDPIPDDARKTEAEVYAAFDRVHARILGRSLDAVACALKNEGTTRPPRLPRMAELAVTVTAAEPALGWEPGSFLAIYTDARRGAVEGLLEGNSIVVALQQLPKPWSGTADALRRQIAELVPSTDAEQLPKTAKGMANALRDLAPGLRQAGIADVQFEERRRRIIEIRRIAAEPSDVPITPSTSDEAVEQQR